jgi:hypothetical protein
MSTSDFYTAELSRVSFVSHVTLIFEGDFSRWSTLVLFQFIERPGYYVLGQYAYSTRTVLKRVNLVHFQHQQS